MEFLWSEKRLRSFAAIFRGAPASSSIWSERHTWKALKRTFERDLEALPADVWQKDNLIVVETITQNQILGLVRFLRARPRGVRFVEGVLSSEDYAAWIGPTDVMLLPMIRLSLEPRAGQEFLPNWLPPDVPSSHQGARLPEPASKTIKQKVKFSRRTQEALAAAIARLTPRLPACKARVAERAKDFARVQSPGAYIDVLLAHAKT